MSMDLTQLSNILGNLSVNDLVLALKESQLQTQALQEEIRQLKTAVPSNKNLSDISTSVSSMSESTGSTTDSSAASDLTSSKKSKTLFQSKESQAKLNYVACRMVFFGNIWWETKELSGSALEYDVAIRKLDSAVVALRAAPHSCQKVLQDRVTVLRIIVKLHEYLPPVYHPLIGATLDGKYYKMFKLMAKKAQEGRSNMMHRFREVGHRIFEGVLPAMHFQNGFDRFTDPECRRLLGYDEVKKQYKRLPPCLFAEGRISGATMFRVQAGIKILLAMLWGKGALDKIKITTRKTNATLWEVNEVNAPCMAFVAIVIRYLLSGDGDFDSPGNRSGIDYDADFEYYLERIEELIQEGAKSISNTFQFYNEQVFHPKVVGASKAPGLPVLYDDEEEEIWRGMKEIEDSPDDPDDFDDTSTSLAFTPQITPAVQANTHDASASQPAQSITRPTSAITAANEIEHVEIQSTEQTVPVKEKRGKRGKKTTAVATVVPRETRATRRTRSTRRVRFEDEVIAAGRKTQGDGATEATLHTSAGTAHPMTSDVISVSAQYDEYDEQEEDEEVEE
ncbi:uncharacterized protein EV420DRAFT_1672078 [Desarmillaria tabescens]|uniref:Uncharacterized protein n=1 Tax=Armillaria tabescens TaxID=1929756 RepID=A0AA39J6Y6_ARMTA|nr:uncharacterized protein EV420DRAFT_1672078 [Desarmillaria tabescens]KAK0436799.1 hypothetical protein EV420DRAFT_1672078 [Desarmillaria tabescens]